MTRAILMSENPDQMIAEIEIQGTPEVLIWVDPTHSLIGARAFVKTGCDLGKTIYREKPMEFISVVLP